MHLIKLLNLQSLFSNEGRAVALPPLEQFARVLWMARPYEGRQFDKNGDRQADWPNVAKARFQISRPASAMNVVNEDEDGIVGWSSEPGLAIWQWTGKKGSILESFSQT
jgi:hypothetical protein